MTWAQVSALLRIFSVLLSKLPLLSVPVLSCNVGLSTLSCFMRFSECMYTKCVEALKYSGTEGHLNTVLRYIRMIIFHLLYPRMIKKFPETIIYNTLSQKQWESNSLSSAIFCVELRCIFGVRVVILSQSLSLRIGTEGIVCMSLFITQPQ